MSTLSRGLNAGTQRGAADSFYFAAILSGATVSAPPRCQRSSSRDGGGGSGGGETGSPIPAAPAGAGRKGGSEARAEGKRSDLRWASSAHSAVTALCWTPRVFIAAVWPDGGEGGGLKEAAGSLESSTIKPKNQSHQRDSQFQCISETSVTTDVQRGHQNLAFF